MSLLTRGLGTRLLITRGLGDVYYFLSMIILFDNETKDYKFVNETLNEILDFSD